MTSNIPDVLVVGSGAAGLTAALTAADQGASVLMVTKGHAPDSSSWHAQGGIAATMGDDDTTALHQIDTERAGRDLCRPSAVHVLVEEGPERVRELIAFGVPFDPELSLEGGHSRRRVSSVEGAVTGWAVTSLLERRAVRDERIAITQETDVRGLWVEGGQCLGVVTATGTIRSRATVLAMGGAAALWARSTNPMGQIGDAIALAVRAGAAVADMEFMQFHPTVLEGSRLLLTEALRGEGATLLDAAGERFVDELAPRDEVARAMVRQGRVFLDLRAIDRGRFPGLMAEIERSGYDPARAPVPVSPAAHYTIGGIVTDLDGRTDIPRLYAAGRMRRDRRPRSQPARFQLAPRMPGLRQARGPGGARRVGPGSRRRTTWRRWARRRSLRPRPRPRPATATAPAPATPAPTSASSRTSSATRFGVRPASCATLWLSRISPASRTPLPRS